MNYKSILTAASALATLCAAAADFPYAGGDLASSTDWGQAVPGSSDDVVLTSSGTYSLGGDVAFKSLSAGSGVSSLVFDFANSGNHTVTLHGTTDREVLKPVAKDDGTAVFKGGVWKFNTPVAVTMAIAKMQRANVVFTDGCIVTNTAGFWVGWGSTLSRLDVTNRASVYAASEFNLNAWGGSSNVLSITAGGVVSVNADIRTDALDDADRVSGNGFLVRGAGSKLRQTNTGAGIKIGFKCSENWLRVEDGGECSDAGRLVIGSFAQSTRNEVLVRNGGTLSVNKLAFTSSNNRLVVSDAVFQATESVDLGNSASVTGNVMRVAGPTTIFNYTGNVFGSGCNNTFELADGATWRLGGANILSMMNGGSNNVLRVTGGAVLDNTSSDGNANFWLNYETRTWENNTLEVLDGATVKVESLFVHGVGTKIVVSNATLQAYATLGYGIWLGRSSGASKQKLIVQGATPRVILNEYKSSNGSALRFEIPAEGYAEGYVPVTARVLNPANLATEKFEIDCAAWAANPNAEPKIVLMRCDTAISSTQADWIAAQNPNLPENVKLSVVGGEVRLAKILGTKIIFR